MRSAANKAARCTAAAVAATVLLLPLRCCCTFLCARWEHFLLTAFFGAWIRVTAKRKLWFDQKQKAASCQLPIARSVCGYKRFAFADVAVVVATVAPTALARMRIEWNKTTKLQRQQCLRRVVVVLRCCTRVVSCQLALAWPALRLRSLWAGALFPSRPILPAWPDLAWP